MRVAKILLGLVAVLVAGSALAGQFSPGLEAYLAEKHDGDTLKAILILDDQVDVTAMDLDLHFQRTSLADRHFRVVTALQEKAAETQGPLLADLESRLGKGIDGYKAYWLINAVMVTGSVDVIRELAGRNDVAVAEMDLIPELIEPIKSVTKGEKAERGIGIAPGIVAVGARRVWDELGIRGQGALIGSLDTGVDGSHPALSSRWRGTHAPWNECWLDVLGTNTQFPNDGNDHGTHTTGTMTGLAPGDTIGIAPGAEWIAANAINQGANSGFDSDILDCLQFFTEPDGDPGTMDDVPDVVQNSWGVNENFTGYVDCDSRWWAAIDACEAAGVALCWSAGNEGSGSQTMRSPADRATTLYNCFSVGATEYYAPFTIANYSSRGPAGPNCGPVANRMKPEISAPGSNIYSSVPGGGYQGGWNGTSMAGPHVAGTMALMRSANPNVDVITMKQVLMETALDRGAPGEDNDYGHGFLDAYAAVLAVAGGLGTVEGTVTDRDTGSPIDGVRITVTDGFQSDVTEADGRYALTLPEGASTINAAAFGYANASTVVNVYENQTTYQDITMVPLASATVTGTVYTAGSVPNSATPQPGALVAVGGTPLPGVTTDAGGNFSFVVPVGSVYEFQATAAGSGAISQLVPVNGDMHLDLYLSALTQDGFETGNLSALPWATNGNANWFVQSATVHSGTRAAQSGDVSDNQNSNLQVTIDCGAGGEVSFWYKVSSEPTYDFLEFYVDGVRLDRWSGELGWSLYSTTVTGGTHTFRFNYDKDYSVSDGSDCGWIDDVTFPGGSAPVPLCVPAPTAIVLTTAPSQTVTVPLLVMNQGASVLEGTASVGGWASIADGYVSAAAYGYDVVDVEISTYGLAPGYHTTDISIVSNDPANPTLQVPIQLTVSGDLTPVEDAPHAFQLVGAQPNPFNPQTTIKYVLPETGLVRLRLYDLQGRLVRTLVDGAQAAGLNEARWDGRDGSGRAMASGTYFARLEQGAQRSVKPLVLVR
ncbi:MAG: S8 family serine peptidase [Candidatus Krumholzibacteriia bacterium]